MRKKGIMDIRKALSKCEQYLQQPYKNLSISCQREACTKTLQKEWKFCLCICVA